jgi:dTDP-4-dehydrorhamnose reductase
MKTIKSVHPDVVIHSAAMTDVDKCESNHGLAYLTNVQGTRNMALAAQSVGAKFVYVSTDYVFDGRKGRYVETDETGPVNFYGKTKLEGEHEASRIDPTSLIVRSSVIYGSRPSAGKKNVALWILENLSARKEINLAMDWHGCPTLNTNLGEMILSAVSKGISGVLHTSGVTRVSRYEFAVALAGEFDLDDTLIRSVRLDDLPIKARRPADSSLDVSLAFKSLGSKPMRMGDALRVMRQEIEEEISDARGDKDLVRHA